ncbi:DNA polymerase III subunit gamma/tau [Microbacterium sp. SSM24]|uniref:DNA polymerase III subunit gamma/tau n=1 Tax=Microbacterium sp. SSM24 TaxID=2991714 RepID=UPI0022269395|nr:DNA polymerase III subunit gamma/tau [Microbacterium sp. SSM24]MCW3494190.1 DNA polymerase III subunit gamma/tau [Microbacterium sp. SSM24]
MPTGRDDEALSWGDDDPTLDVGSRAEDAVETAPSEPAAPAETVVLPEGYTAVGRGSESLSDDGAPRALDEQDDSDARDDDSPAMGNAELISLGVLGGFSVLYAVGWLIGGLRLQGTAEFLVAPLAYQVSLWLAVLAPLVWFATVLVLTRGRRLWVRFAWLVGGVVLLVPWPFIMVGAIGR